MTTFFEKCRQNVQILKSRSRNFWWSLDSRSFNQVSVPVSKVTVSTTSLV